MLIVICCCWGCSCYFCHYFGICFLLAAHCQTNRYRCLGGGPSPGQPPSEEIGHCQAVPWWICIFVFSPTITSPILGLLLLNLMGCWGWWLLLMPRIRGRYFCRKYVTCYDRGVCCAQRWFYYIRYFLFFIMSTKMESHAWSQPSDDFHQFRRVG